MSNPQIHQHSNLSEFNTDQSPVPRSSSSHGIRESGQALFVFVALILVAAAGLVLGFLRPSAFAIANDNKTSLALAQAKDTLMGWAISHPVKPGLLPYPDRNSDGSYDGYSDCPPQDSNLVGNNLLLGRLPFIGEKLPCINPRTTMGIDKVDGNGERLWYAVSSNLVDDRISGSTPNIPGNLNGGSNWLTVRDGKGTILSSLIAFIVLSSGPLLPGQDRSGAAPDATNFLDNFTVGATTYSNWDVALGFVSAEDTAKVPAGSNQFNDRLLYVTRDEYRNAIAKRVAGELKLLLSQFYTTNGFYPFAALLPDGECVDAQMSGYIPSQDTVPVGGDCSGGALTGLLPPPSWFVDWESYVAYTRNSPNSVTLTIFGRNFDVVP